MCARVCVCNVCVGLLCSSSSSSSSSRYSGEMTGWGIIENSLGCSVCVCVYAWRVNMYCYYGE